MESLRHGPGPGDGVNTTSLTVEEGAYIDMTAFAIAGNGTNDRTEFTIKGGQIYSDTFVIYHPRGGKLNIEGGTLEGPNGVYFSGYGEVNISDGQITATADRAEAPFKDPSEGDGPAQDGAALSIVSRSGGYQSQGDTIEVNITGGTLISQNNSAIAEYRLQKINGQWVVNYDGEGPDDPNVIPNFVSSVSVSGNDTRIQSAEGLDCFYADNPEAIGISGGSFSSDVSDYLEDNASGSYEDGEFVVSSPITVTIVFDGTQTSQELPAGSTVADLTAPTTEPADDGYLYAWADGYGNMIDPATVLQNGDTYEYRLFLETPTVSVSTSGPLYPGSFITVTVNASLDASNVSLIYYYIVGDLSDPYAEIKEISEYNTFTISSPGTYTFLAMAFDESGVNSNPGYTVIDIEQSSLPVYPDDDDDYVPPIYVPGDTSSSDDDTVKIVACAAAAVVAAIMAAFLILGHRRD